ncbi:unnamed protein product [Amaranthus hypochondriacus]
MAVSIPKRVGIPGSLRIMAVSKKVSGESDKNSESDDGQASLAQVVLFLITIICSLCILLQWRIPMRSRSKVSTVFF